MTAMSSNPNPLFLPPAGVRLASPAVNIGDTDLALQTFLVVAGLVHLHLFDERLIVQLGRDEGHTPGDAHTMGRAIDLEMMRSDPYREAAFLAVCDVLAMRFRLVIIKAGTPVSVDYVHIEVAE